MTAGVFEVEGGDWFDRTPPPAVPVPAADLLGDLDSRPALLIRSGVGVLSGLRIFGEAYEHHGRPHVDLQSEEGYWRARLNPGTPAPALRTPLERVRVEYRQVDEQAPAPATAADAYEVWDRLAPGPDTPGLRVPVPARTVRHLHGRRIIQVTPLGWAWDLRAISEPYDLDGDITLNCCSAQDYYRWLIFGTPPPVAPLPLYLLWTE